MREIKLRSYNKESGKFFYFCTGRYYSDYRLSCCVSERVCSEFQWSNTEKYTGLKDKNGKEIYEGDIVRVITDDRYPEGIGAVEWNKNTASFEFGCGVASEVNWSHEVIGNIYENPELINKPQTRAL